MFKKWDDKFATGRMVDGHSVIVNLSGQPRIPMKLEVCEAGMGDLLETFVELHTVTPRWLRRWVHPMKSVDAKIMRDKLNEIATIRWAR